MVGKVKVLIGVVLILLSQILMSDGCWEDERIALLGLKSFFGKSSSLNWLREDDLHTLDCCLWEGVECNNSTGQVVQLNLDHANENCSFYDYFNDASSYCDCFGNKYFNASLLLPFQRLKILSLTCNGIEDWVEPQVIEGPSAMVSQLEVLDLSFNGFGPSLISSLGGFSSLRSLKLAGNILSNFSDFESLSTKLRHLQVLDLSFSAFRGGNLSSLSGFSSLKSLNLKRIWSFLQLNDFESLSTKLRHLQVLDLSFSFFRRGNLSSLNGFSSLKFLDLKKIMSWQGNAIEDIPYLKNLEYLSMDGVALNIPSLRSVGVMKSLRTLSLHGCRLSGPLSSAQGLCDLIHLQKLDFSNNDLTGSLPWCLGNFTSLQELDLSLNRFTGNISVFSLGSLTSLYYLQLSNNHLQIPISLAPFFNLSKLKHVDVGNNYIYAETVSDSLAPKFQLRTLVLSGHGYGGGIPEIFYHQHQLQHVTVKNIKMEGGFPSWLLYNNTELEQLILVNLSLSGPLTLLKHSHTHLSHLDMSGNYLLGQIPLEIGAYLPNLKYLNMSGSGCHGSIPVSISQMNLLRTLDLSDNQLSGKFPEQFSIRCSCLRILVLSNNRLEGRLLSSKSNWENLTWLELDTNHFTGGIPDGLRNSSSLEFLDISNNYLDGEIPEWIGNMLNLKVLDLSDNNIMGTLPVGFSPPNIFHVRLAQNRLKGSLQNAFCDSSMLMTLDLSHNNFSGTVSNWLSSFNGLTHLLLNNNNLEGGTPIQFCKFTELRLFDLSHNQFSGLILPCLNDQEWVEAANGFVPLPSSTPTNSNSITVAPLSRYVLTPPFSPIQSQEPLQFTTKRRAEHYRGRILELMSGIDLSCNRFTGKIPPGIGSLRYLKSLNLSHNSLTGSIPLTLSNLTEIESLDVSNNSLSGNIPPQLTQLYSLSVFNASYNNLSGSTPQRVNQFGTFDNDSYYGNPMLCGLPLSRSCNPTEPSIPILNYREDENGFVDMEVFYVSFVVTYVCILMGIAAVLYINPRWRRMWFYFIERGNDTCYYFIVVSLRKLSKFRIM